jgi:hypothetical protein
VIYLVDAPACSNDTIYTAPDDTRFLLLTHAALIMPAHGVPPQILRATAGTRAGRCCCAAYAWDDCAADAQPDVDHSIASGRVRRRTLRIRGAGRDPGELAADQSAAPRNRHADHVSTVSPTYRARSRRRHSATGWMARCVPARTR